MTATQPTPPPRPCPPAVRRRAWIEPHVRFWWTAALILMLAGIYLLATRFLVWRQEARLINSGIVVPAVVLQADESTARGKTESGDKSVRLRFDYNGQTYEVQAAYLAGRKSEQFIIVGDSIPIRVDPADPSRWTPRQSPAPLLPELIGGFITLSVAVIVFLMSTISCKRVLAVWRAGEGKLALVLAARHTALAPMAWSVRCTPVGDDDKRVFHVFVPARVRIAAGETLWVLIAPGGGRTLAAAWMQ